MISSDRHVYSYSKELRIIAFPLQWFSSNPDAVAQVNGAGGAYRVIPTPGNLIGGLMGRGGGGTASGVTRIVEYEFFKRLSLKHVRMNLMILVVTTVVLGTHIDNNKLG